MDTSILRLTLRILRLCWHITKSYFSNIIIRFPASDSWTRFAGSKVSWWIWLRSSTKQPTSCMFRGTSVSFRSLKSTLRMWAFLDFRFLAFSSTGNSYRLFWMRLPGCWSYLPPLDYSPCTRQFWLRERLLGAKLCTGSLGAVDSSLLTKCGVCLSFSYFNGSFCLADWFPAIEWLRVVSKGSIGASVWWYYFWIASLVAILWLYTSGWSFTCAWNFLSSPWSLSLWVLSGGFSYDGLIVYCFELNSNWWSRA